MQAVITAEFLDNVPESIRRRLNLVAGTVMDFDEQAPFLKATPAEPASTDAMDEFQSWLAASVGLAKDKFTTDEQLGEIRGEYLRWTAAGQGGLAQEGNNIVIEKLVDDWPERFFDDIRIERPDFGQECEEKQL
jgi:hypothetical protein